MTTNEPEVVMLELRVKGDEHPKTFTLVTDDADGDPIGEWFAATDRAGFQDGADIPGDEMADFVELLEGDWPDAWQVFDKERQDAFEKAEDSLGD